MSKFYFFIFFSPSEPAMEDRKAQQTPLKKKRRSRADSIREALPPGPLSSIAKRAARQALSFVHILTWIPNYSKDDIVCDVIAGITIGLTMLPQSIAYALLAGLSPQVSGNSRYSTADNC